jgi:hypothetical protein
MMILVLIKIGRAIAAVGIVLAWPGCFLIDLGDVIESAARSRRSKIRQSKITAAHPDFVVSYEVE